MNPDTLPMTRADNFPHVRYSSQDKEGRDVERDPKNKYCRIHMSSSICAGVCALLLIAAGVPMVAMGDEMVWWMWSTFPFSGTLFGLMVLIWFSGRDEESRRKLKWTAVHGVVFGIGMPRLALYVHPWISASPLMRDPIVLWMIGFVCFLLFSGAAVGIMRWRERRSADVAFEQLDRYAKRNLPQPTDKLDP